MDSSYYYYEYSPELGKKLNTKIYSDTTVSLLELAQKEGLSPSPLLSSTNPFFRTELSKNYIITTTVAQDQVFRVIFSGNFTFSGFELTGGIVNELILVSKDGAIRGKVFSSPVSYQQIVSVGVSKAISSYSGDSITTLGKFDQFFPNKWFENPFGQNLVSTTTIDFDNIFYTTSNVDNLTGVVKKRDLFQFSSEPTFGAQADIITNFSTKDKDLLEFSKYAFGITVGKFAIAKNSKKLNQLLASDTSFIYNQKSGELIFNANGVEAGYGDTGGVFAQLVGSPKLLGSSVSFF